MYDLMVHGFGDGAAAGACPTGRTGDDTGATDDDGVAGTGAVDGSGWVATVALGNVSSVELGSAGSATAGAP